MAKVSIETVRITPPNFKTLVFRIDGVAPYCCCAFSKKAGNAMREKMEQGSKSKKGTKREARDFDADFEGARHLSSEGWDGIPASSFRNAMIDVCRMVGFKMTHAKMSVFVEADGLDEHSGQPLVRLIAGKPEKHIAAVRNATGVLDLRARPLWRVWGADVRVRYDADQFDASDVANLLARAGAQVGIGEGRPFSKGSNGLGWGLFVIGNTEEVAHG